MEGEGVLGSVDKAPLMVRTAGRCLSTPEARAGSAVVGFTAVLAAWRGVVRMLVTFRKGMRGAGMPARPARLAVVAGSVCRNFSLKDASPRLSLIHI